MGEGKRTGIVLAEIIIFGVLGLLMTNYTVSAGYEQLDIAFTGNIWVIWFAGSFLLFCFYNMFIFCLPKKYPMQKRIHTKSFWVLFLLAIWIIIIPVWIGEIPY